MLAPSISILLQTRLAKLKSQFVKLTFKVTASETIAYSDASFANLKDGKSQGYIVFIKLKDGVISPLSWRSRKIKRVVKSTLAAETLALDEAADQCFYLRSVLTEVFRVHDSDTIPVKLYSDCTSLYDAVH